MFNDELSDGRNKLLFRQILSGLFTQEPAHHLTGAHTHTHTHTHTKATVKINDVLIAPSRGQQQFNTQLLSTGVLML